METVCSVTVGDRERVFKYKRDAIDWLVALAKDARTRPMVCRRPGGGYAYYGPGRDVFVTRAVISRMSFPKMRRRRAPRNEGVLLDDLS